jgi:predicted secreted hydrolase
VRRRTFLATATLLPLAARAAVEFPQVVPQALAFPRDHGSHPGFRTEWWYITGWAEDARGVARGVQVTFFRTRPGIAEDVKSALAPTQLLFAHAAVADPALQRLRHDQRAARAVLGLARAAEDTTDVVLDDWTLRLSGDTYRTHIPARDFTLDLAFTATQAPLLQGDAGVSRKGPQPAQASHYYSRPHLALDGTITQGRVATAVTGRAWLDHEWSSEYLAPGARGWDWIGINLDDGAALMAFRIRGDGDRVVWAGGALRAADGRVTALGPDDVRFEPLRRWTSPRTGLSFPVAMRVSAGTLTIELEPLFDDQELDARASVGTVYWEGAVQASGGGRRVGRGYLELTGYGAPLKI